MCHRCRPGAGSVPGPPVPARRSPPMPARLGCRLGRRAAGSVTGPPVPGPARFPPAGSVPAKARFPPVLARSQLMLARRRHGSRRSRCRLDAGSVRAPPVPARGRPRLCWLSHRCCRLRPGSESESESVPARSPPVPARRLSHRRCRLDAGSVTAGAGSVPAGASSVQARCRLGACSVLAWFPPLGSRRLVPAGAASGSAPTGVGSVPVHFLFTQIKYHHLPRNQSALTPQNSHCFQTMPPFHYLGPMHQCAILVQFLQRVNRLIITSHYY